jgi:hypothetical protein
MLKMPSFKMKSNIYFQKSQIIKKSLFPKRFFNDEFQNLKLSIFLILLDPECFSFHEMTQLSTFILIRSLIIKNQ